MLLIHRILLYTKNFYELLFDLDFSNIYGKEDVRVVIKSSKHELPPVYSLESLNPPRTVCRIGVDQIFITLMTEKLELIPLEKSTLLKIAKDYANLCQSFIGSLNQQNVLTNVARLAELTDHVFIAGRTHLLSAERIRGFITTPYIETTTLHSASLPSSLLSTTRLITPNHQNKVLSSHSETLNSRATAKTLPKGENAIAGGDLYVDLIENVTLISNSSAALVQTVTGSLDTNNTSTSPINIHFKFKNVERLGNELTFHKAADGSRFRVDQELVASGAPVGQASLLTYSNQVCLKEHRALFTLQAVHIKNGDNDGLKFLLQCNCPHGSVSMKTFICFKLPAAFTHNKGALSTLKKLPTHNIHLRSPGKEELIKPNERELDSFHSDVELVWSIPEIHGQVATELVVQFLPRRRKEDSSSTDSTSAFQLAKIDALMTFEISNFLASGAKLTGVRLDKHLSVGVKKWVRQLTTSGAVYEISCNIHD